MNLLEHYIRVVYEVKDVTEECEKSLGYKVPERILEVRMRIDCYGAEEYVKMTFYESNWHSALKAGFYMA